MPQLSGQITVTTAGTAVQGPANIVGHTFLYTAHPGNAGTVALGNDGAGDVTMANGHVLSPGVGVALAIKPSELFFDASNDADVICWIVYNRQ